MVNNCRCEARARTGFTRRNPCGCLRPRAPRNALGGRKNCDGCRKHRRGFKWAFRIGQGAVPSFFATAGNAPQEPASTRCEMRRAGCLWLRRLRRRLFPRRPRRATVLRRRRRRNGLRRGRRSHSLRVSDNLLLHMQQKVVVAMALENCLAPLVPTFCAHICAVRIPCFPRATDNG